MSSKKNVAEQRSSGVMTTNPQATDQYSTATDISDGTEKNVTKVEPPVPGENNSISIAAKPSSTPERKSLTDKLGQILPRSSDTSEKTETESDLLPHVPDTTKLDQKPVTREKPSAQSTTEKDVSETKFSDVMKDVSMSDNYSGAVTKDTPTFVTQDVGTGSTSASEMPESREEESVVSQV